MSIIFSFGKSGGFYCHSKRLCLGWMAVTIMLFDIDVLLQSWRELAQIVEGRNQ